MSAPGLPPLHRMEPPAEPAGAGLYGAATVVDLGDPSRLSGGVLLESRNIGGHGLWPAGCTPDDHTGVKGGPEDCPGSTLFPATVVWASDDRKLPGVTDDDARLSASQTLRVTEQPDVEKWVAELLAARAGTPATASGTGGDALVAALGAVEGTGGLSGLPLTIHAPRSVAALAASKGLITRVGGRWETPLGNRWAFGAGYADDLAGTLVATGPVTVLRSTITHSTGLDLTNNQRLVIAEREVVVTWDGPTVAASI